MDIEALEESFLVYYKLLDGLRFEQSRTRVVCDLSFNRFITAKYIADKFDVENVIALSKDKMILHDKIQPVKVSGGISRALASVKCDLLVSIAGSFHFQPVYEVVHAVHKCLNVGGKFIFVLYPTIMDQSGNDVIKSLGLISNQNVAEKIVRWRSVINNSMSNIFININEDELMQTVSFDEIKGIFRSESFYSHLFDSEDQYNDFFKPLDAVTTNTYSASWHIISGIRI